MWSEDIDRITQRSSARSRTCGKRSLISVPHRPAGPKLPVGTFEEALKRPLFALPVVDRDRLAVPGHQQGLGIKRVDVGDAAGHAQEDDTLGPGLEVGWLGRERVGRGGGSLLLGEEARQGDRTEAPEARVRSSRREIVRLSGSLTEGSHQSTKRNALRA